MFEVKSLILFLIHLYRRGLSPFLGNHCRFYPSCSAYALEVVQKKGALDGIRMSFMRILKCHPFHSGGFDPVES